MGMWSFVAPRIETATRVLNGEEKRPQYVGRRASAATATGYGAWHNREQDKLVEQALE